MKKSWVLATVLLVGALAVPASANMILTIDCSAAGLSGSQQFLVQCNAGVVDWTLPAAVDVVAANGTRLAAIRQLTLQSDTEPYVNVRFAVEAAETDTTFRISSTIVSFATLTDPKAYASAGVTLTSNEDGATITGLLDGGTLYEARYNHTSVYADLVSSFSIAADQTITHGQRLPTSGYATIAGGVSSIESEFYFTLSALDQASGTSRFEVVPEPMTMGLLTLGGLVMLYRRIR